MKSKLDFIAPSLTPKIAKDLCVVQKVALFADLKNMPSKERHVQRRSNQVALKKD